MNIRNEKIDTTRRENLKSLLSRVNSMEKLSDLCNLPPGTIDRLITGKDVFSHNIASKIENRLNLPVGWLDWVTEGMSRQDVRYRNLKSYIAKVAGSRSKFAKKFGIPLSRVNYWFARTVIQRSYGENIPEDIEKEIGLPEGSLSQI
ncbi:MAG: helix-turn-helix transcriptional regulator [Methyloprofundus sp.]|nr:helix-turn-helix transcriptional regulator [Methyloprofundus sp.]